MTSGFAKRCSRSICSGAGTSAVLAHPMMAGGSMGQRERR
jgi:hypothetical protein